MTNIKGHNKIILSSKKKCKFKDLNVGTFFIYDFTLTYGNETVYMKTLHGFLDLSTGLHSTDTPSQEVYVVDCKIYVS